MSHIDIDDLYQCFGTTALDLLGPTPTGSNPRENYGKTDSQQAMDQVYAVHVRISVSKLE